MGSGHPSVCERDWTETAAALEALGIHTVYDLLYYFHGGISISAVSKQSAP